MTLVVDASVLVAALVDGGAAGERARAVLADGDLVAPHILPAEVTNVLRRLVAGGHLSVDNATMASQDMSQLPIRLVPFDPFSGRVWELRETVTTYDAWYVAVAEALAAPLATLDGRLKRAPGPRCTWAM